MPRKVKAGQPEPSPLRREAEDILLRLGLLTHVAQFGEAALMGSVALDLIVKLDIDVAVVATGRDLFAAMASTARYLFDQAEVREVRLTDERTHGGYKLGIDAYPGPSGLWSVDVWFTDRRETAGFDLCARLRGELTPEHREAILAIKRDRFAAGAYPSGTALRIYDAVLYGGIRTPERFRAWLDSIESISTVEKRGGSA